jgi:8-oxo-dGTP pyrophosphatase MutT (NUDIX family)
MSDPLSPTLAASAACFRDGKVLIAKRIRPPLWSLPGGRIEPGETPEAAAMRELFEETGVEAEIVALAGEREVVLKDEGGGLAARVKIFASAARWRAGEAKPGPEASEIAWVGPEALSAYKTTEGLLPIVMEAKRLIG